MKNYFYQAKLIDIHKISIFIFSSMPREAETKIYFHRPNQYPMLMKVNRMTSVSDTTMIEVELPYDYPFGEACFISFGSYNAVEVDVSNAVDFPEFDGLFNYDGDDLGAIYSKEETRFNLWAPLASSVSLKLENEDGSFSIYNMERTEKGVYSIVIKGDLLNRKYHYLVLNSGTLRETNDPFGRGASLDSKYSAVVDYQKFLSNERIKPTLEIKKNTDALIYELHVRDFTESKTTNIVNKGKYLGLCEEGRKSKKGHPAG